MNTTDKIMALANTYAASNGKALLEKLYGTSQSYTEQCSAEAFKDREALREAIETLVRDAERLCIERDHAKALYDGASRLIGGIYALMYPPKTKLADGRVMVFRPKELDPHVVLQELSDRIRVLPDEIAAMQEKQS